MNDIFPFFLYVSYAIMGQEIVSNIALLQVDDVGEHPTLVDTRAANTKMEYVENFIYT